jgi:hypothetical protein
LEKRRAGEIDEASIERRHEDGSFDKLEAEETIKAGVLQIIDSQFVGLGTQKRAGESEMRDGINKAFEARQKAKQHWDAQQRPLPRRRFEKRKNSGKGAGPVAAD